jgi:hypothetical protein
MNDEMFVRRIAGHLSAAAREVDPVVGERLRNARERALQVQRKGGFFALFQQHALALRVRFALAPALRSSAMAVVLVAVFLGGDYWTTVSRVTALQEVDAALLMDDLPIEAYLDPDFRAWLSRDSHS